MRIREARTTEKIQLQFFLLLFSVFLLFFGFRVHRPARSRHQVEHTSQHGDQIVEN